VKIFLKSRVKILIETVQIGVKIIIIRGSLWNFRWNVKENLHIMKQLKY